MIAVVYWRLCLLFVICGSHRITDELEFPQENYSQQSKTIRVKYGSPLTLKCHQKKAKWQFKPCISSFHRIVCNATQQWKKLENETIGRIRFAAVNKQHTGLYKCFQNDAPVLIFSVDVFDSAYSGSPPVVNPLQISNITGPINMEFTIQCKVTSDVPPTIIWFKTCYGRKCDFPYHRSCYCHINTSISHYNTGSTYLSKYLIFNARNVDSGTYICLGVNQFGKDVQNITISVPCKKNDEFYSLLFLIPFGLLLVPLIVWLCYFRRKRKPVVAAVDQHKQLIRSKGPVNEIM